MARAGDVIGGKYRLIHPLGIGGMGTVWRAEHVALKQQVAIKLLDARGPAADRAVKRFQREAQIAASIRHRNIVYISDFGTEGGAPYLVMELLSGVPLSERFVVGEPLSVASFLRIIEETLQGLAAVHAAGVVHRDMKPENIFLVREGEGEAFPKLLDFGVSRSTERNAGHTITREGIVMGTPEYVSPEQARGKMADLRSDIYSLGVVTYEALAGRLPFQADNAADLIVATLNAEPIPLVSLRPDLGDGLSLLVHRAMARNPNDRFQNTDEMRVALLALLDQEPALDECYLPRRFVAPHESMPPSVAPDTPDASDALDPELRPTKAESLPPRSTHNLSLLVARSRKRLVTWAVGTAAVLAALVIVSLVSGVEKSSSARVASRALARQPDEPIAAVAPTAPVPNEAVVELVGVPEQGSVRVDGVPVAGSMLRLPRGSGRHEITVDAPGKQTWRILHDAEHDGRYAIALEPAPEKKRRRSAREKNKSGLLRRPDF